MYRILNVTVSAVLSTIVGWCCHSIVYGFLAALVLQLGAIIGQFAQRKPATEVTSKPFNFIPAFMRGASNAVIEQPGEDDEEPILPPNMEKPTEMYGKRFDSESF